MRNKLEDAKGNSSPRAAGRETAYFPQTVEAELKELTQRFKHVPVAIVRKNADVCLEYGFIYPSYTESSTTFEARQPATGF